MFEKVNPSHPDKVADRIAGAIVDLAYSKRTDPKIAVEVLIGHNQATIQIESNLFNSNSNYDMAQIIERIVDNKLNVNIIYNDQDPHLAKNQEESIKCGDNGIFKGMPINFEEYILSDVARDLYSEFNTDGKFIFNLTRREMTICQSNAKDKKILNNLRKNLKNKHKSENLWDDLDIYINPLGEWTGGINVDTGATNRKLGSDMGRAVTGGGLHGKDLSKADVSVNIYCHLMAQRLKNEIKAICSIGDDRVLVYTEKTTCYVPYAEIVETARVYIANLGGFEKLAEWGLV